MKKLLFVLLPALVLLAGCQKETGTHVETEEKEVNMQIKAPTMLTRADIPSESSIERLDVLVFEGPEDGHKFLYRRYAWPTGSNAAYRTTLKVGDNLTLYFVANAKAILDASPLLAEGSTATWAQIRETLLMSNPETTLKPSLGLPMWGRKIEVTIEDEPLSDIGTVNLVRSIASADFELKKEAKQDFDIEAVYLVYAADKGYLPYDPAKTSSSGATTGPSVPSGIATNVDWMSDNFKNESEGGISLNNVFYMFENDAGMTPPVEGDNSTKLVMAGKWKGDGAANKTTYYPIAFREVGSDGKAKKLIVTRNYKYEVKVSGVNGNGYGTLEEAKLGEEVNVDFEVIPWNDTDHEEIIVIGTKRVSIERKKANVFKGYGTWDWIEMTTNYTDSDIVLSNQKGDEVKINATYSDWVSIVDEFAPEKLEFASVRIGRKSTGVYEFSFRTDIKIEDTEPKEYFRQGTLYVEIGLVSFEILVRQHNMSQYEWENGGETVWPET